MTIRVYLPCTLPRLREVVTSGGLGPGPLRAFAVTDDLREELRDAGDEDWEYAAMSAAAQEAIGLLGEDDPPRRTVVVAEIESVTEVDRAGVGLVEVHDVVPMRNVVAVHVDSEDAEADVAAARDAWSAAEAGDADASALVDRAMEHELGWFATQEVGDLL